MKFRNLFLRSATTLGLALFVNIAGIGLAQAHDKQASQAPRMGAMMNLDQLMRAFQWDMDNAEIRVEKVTDNFYVLFGLGGNIGVSIGSQGVMIVDDQFPELIPKVADAIRGIGGGSIDFAINTHWHFDHAEGNLALGPGGTWIVSQANSREKMLGDHVINLVVAKYLQKAYPKSALPVITYDDTMQFHFNDEQVDLMHFGPAHTTGDTAIYFRGSNVVHLGDVFNRSGYPFVDADNGGDLAGMIHFCEQVLASIEQDTVVVPGHGEISDYAGLQAYVDMLQTVHDRIAKMVRRGKTMGEVIAAKPTADYDAAWGDATNFVNRAYTSIKKARAAKGKKK